MLAVMLQLLLSLQLQSIFLEVKKMENMLFCLWNYMLGFKTTCEKKNFGKNKIQYSQYSFQERLLYFLLRHMADR
jgi:hypothetical protein